MTTELRPEAAQARVDPLAEFAQAFKAARAALRRLRSRETRRPGELSDAQYGLLFGLCERSEQSTSELAYAAEVSQASATEMLEGLETAGLVVRARSARDRRVVLTSLTDRGRQLVEQRRAEFEPRWRAALAEFSEEELLVAARVLDRVRELFDHIAEDRDRA